VYINRKLGISSLKVIKIKLLVAVVPLLQDLCWWRSWCSSQILPSLSQLGFKCNLSCYNEKNFKTGLILSIPKHQHWRRRRKIFLGLKKDQSQIFTANSPAWAIIVSEIGKYKIYFLTNLNWLATSLFSLDASVWRFLG